LDFDDDSFRGFVGTIRPQDRAMGLGYARGADGTFFEFEEDVREGPSVAETVLDDLGDLGKVPWGDTVLEGTEGPEVFVGEQALAEGAHDLADFDIDPPHLEDEVDEFGCRRLAVAGDASLEFFVGAAVDAVGFEFEGLVVEDEGAHAFPELDGAAESAVEGVEGGEEEEGEEERGDEGEEEDFSFGVGGVEEGWEEEGFHVAGLEEGEEGGGSGG